MHFPALVVYAMAFQLTPHPPPAPPSNCAADGVVVNSITGEPVPRAHVMSAASQTSGTADNLGHWSLTNIACGRLLVTATRPGFLNGGVRDPVTVNSESPAHGVRIQLTPQSVVLGKVTDEQGDPVMNAQVSVLGARVVGGRRTFQMTAAAQSNDLGEFRIASLPAGRFIFCAHGVSANGNDLVQGETCFPGPVEGGAASAMELPAGREVQVNFSLRQVPTVHVRGTVTGMPKNQGAGITLQQPGPSRGPVNVRPANITPDGHFEIRGVTPGSYILFSDYWEGSSRLTARVPLEVGGSDVEGITVHLEQGASIDGTIRVESTTGKTLPNQSWPLNLRSSDPSIGGGQPKWDKARNTFTIADAAPGAYRLEGTPPPPFYLKSAMLGGRDMTREEVPIGPAAGQIEVVIGDDSGTIEGVVQDSAGATVMAIQEGRSPRIVSIGPDGHFRIANLPPGDYRVYAWDDITQAEYADPEWMKHHGDKGQSVTVSPGQTAPLKLDLGQTAR